MINLYIKSAFEMLKGVIYFLFNFFIDVFITFLSLFRAARILNAGLKYALL